MKIFTESMKAPLSVSLEQKKTAYIYPAESLQHSCTIFKIGMLTKNPLNCSFSSRQYEPAHWSHSWLIM